MYVDNETDEPHIKLTDFGLARVIDPNAPMLSTRCGSPDYAAPEIVKNLDFDGRISDVWSLGVVIYGLLVGSLPFTPHQNKVTNRNRQLCYNIVSAEITWPKYVGVSYDAKTVVERMLDPVPERRITLREVIELPWFSSEKEVNEW